MDAPTFEDAGKGYAWIMINYDNLSDKNKKILFSLEQTKDSKGHNIGEKVVWFVESFGLMKNSNEKKSLTKKFNERSFILRYNNRYPGRVVFLRMPINKETTIMEVEEYFGKLVQRLKQQELEVDHSIGGRGI